MTTMCKQSVGILHKNIIIIPHFLIVWQFSFLISMLFFEVLVTTYCDIEDKIISLAWGTGACKICVPTCAADVRAFIYNWYYETSKFTNIKIIFFYTQSIRTATCSDLPWSSSGNYLTSINHISKHGWITGYQNINLTSSCVVKYAAWTPSAS